MQTSSRERRRIDEVVSSLLQADTTTLPRNSEEILKLIEILRHHGVLPILYKKLADVELPTLLRKALEAETRTQMVFEVMLKQETIKVLEVFGSEDIHPLLLKGTAFCYSIYPEPHLRPRTDIDLLIHEHEFAEVRKLLLDLGYKEPNILTGEKANYQFPFYRIDSRGTMYQLDIHWKLSNVQFFAKTFSYSELYGRRAPVSALGENAYTLSKVDSLMYSCIHLAAHHYHDERLIWLYDIHLLMELLSERKLEIFVSEATKRDIVAVCAKAIKDCDRFLGTEHTKRLPAEWLEVPTDPSSIYTTETLRQVDIFIADLKELSYPERVKLALEYLFPSPGYIMRKYKASSRLLLPLLYLHRIYTGIKRWLQPRQA